MTKQPNNSPPLLTLVRSRLDRLVQLLDTGASQTVRQAAAKQIAQIATRGLRTDSGIEGEGNDVKPVIDSNGEIPSPPLESRYDWSEVISVLAKVWSFHTQWPLKPTYLFIDLTIPAL